MFFKKLSTYLTAMKIRKFENVKQQKMIGKFKSNHLGYILDYFFILFFNAMEKSVYVTIMK